MEVTNVYAVVKNWISFCRRSSLEHSKFYAIIRFGTNLSKITSVNGSLCGVFTYTAYMLVTEHVFFIYTHLVSQ